MLSSICAARAVAGVGEALAFGVAGAGAAPEFAEGERLERRVDAGDVGFVLRVELERAGRWTGRSVMSYWLGSVGEMLMLAAVDQVEARGLRVGRCRSGDDGLVGGGDVLGLVGWVRSARKTWCQTEASGGWADVLDVEDVVLEVLIEDAGLDFEGCLRGLKLFFQAEEVGGAAGCEVEGVDQADGERGDGEDGDDADEARVRRCRRRAWR